MTGVRHPWSVGLFSTLVLSGLLSVGLTACGDNYSQPTEKPTARTLPKNDQTADAAKPEAGGEKVSETTDDGSPGSAAEEEKPEKNALERTADGALGGWAETAEVRIPEEFRQAVAGCVLALGEPAKGAERLDGLPSIEQLAAKEPGFYKTVGMEQTTALPGYVSTQHKMDLFQVRDVEARDAATAETWLEHVQVVRALVSKYLDADAKDLIGIFGDREYHPQMVAHCTSLDPANAEGKRGRTVSLAVDCTSGETAVVIQDGLPEEADPLVEAAASGAVPLVAESFKVKDPPGCVIPSPQS